MAEQKPKPEEKKSSKKLIIIIIAVIVLLSAGGVGGYYFLTRHPDASPENKGEGGKTDKKSEKAQARSEEDEAATVPAYYDLAQPMVVNFPKGRGVSLVQISVSFLASSEDSAAALKKHEPMLRNNLMMKINAQNPEELKTKEGKNALRMILLTEVNAILDKMVPGKHVKEVFFTTFVMQ